LLLTVKLAVKDEKPCYCSRSSHELLLIVGKNQLLIMTKTSAVVVVEREGCLLQFGWHGLCKQMLVKP